MMWTVWIVLAALAVLLLAFLFLAMPGRSAPEAKAPFWGLNHAHRGLHTADKSRPENSLAAFGAAVEAGYGIELDIQFSKDGQVVVFHDDDLLRVCGVEGRVDSFTCEQLREMRLEGTDEGIPLFTEVLALVDGKSPLIVELKTGPQNAALCKAALDILQAYKGPYCVESFDPRIVGWFKKNAPGVLRGQLAAPPHVLEQGAAGCLIGWGLSHFLGRPQFIAYQAVKRPLPVRFAMAFAMRVVWTLTLQLDAKAFEAASDAAIFEHYLPPTHFK